jgi:predicted PurR-regulated permease PerM
VLLPWALISVIMGNMPQAVGLLVIYGIITITRQVLQPKILGSQMGAHPLASLMSIYIGFRIFGLFGLLIGPSLLMIFIAIRDTRSTS